MNPTGEREDDAGARRPAAARGMGRWWTYQKERFPLAAHGPLIAAFSASAVCYSALLRGAAPAPRWDSFAVAFVTSLIAFLHLRIADEFKDFEEDAQFRPYRPVPRGLVTLRELGWVVAAGALIQAGLALWLEPRLLMVLAAAWLYLAAMSREFFVRDWLVARPFTYMWTHMLILPLVDLYATACDWMIAGRPAAPEGIVLFVFVSFFNGIVIEVGRKIRAPHEEETGVSTYTRLWGRRGAVLFWLGAMLVTGLLAGAASGRIGFQGPAVAALSCVGLGAALLSVWFVMRPASGASRGFEPVSGLWTLALYLMLGVVPYAMRGD